ncbi:maleylpyruvate isomerase N-terminal domain-containing protein [Cellulomonas sp. P22]|uniref:maleylpyruvate isomerase N-terminal domain-containing protein n=1 Tax=Cellulomonas sp. P22 TaxID=3373189 RepID=UPI0037ACA16B
MTTTPQPPSPELAAASDALRTQWATLRPWVAEHVDASTGTLPSILAGWDVADLVAHVGRGMSALTAVEPAPAGTVPLALGEYLAGYGAGAAVIARTTRELTATIASDPLAAIDAFAAAAFARLDELGTHEQVVVARRGPIRLSDMVVSRVVELVVHADDLFRSLDATRTGAAPAAPGYASAVEELDRGILDDAGGRGVLDPAALDLVAQALLDVLVARGGFVVELGDPLTWVRLAAGRIPYDVDAVAVALTAPYTSDAVPDLGRVLPLF